MLEVDEQCLNQLTPQDIVDLGYKFVKIRNVTNNGWDSYKDCIRFFFKTEDSKLLIYYDEKGFIRYYRTIVNSDLDVVIRNPRTINMVLISPLNGLDWHKNIPMTELMSSIAKRTIERLCSK